MKNRAIAATVLLCLVVPLGCRSPNGLSRVELEAPGRLVELESPSQDLSAYRFVAILDFTSSLPGIIPQSLAQDLSQELALEAKLGRHFEGVKQVEETPARSGQPTLVISGEFIDFDGPGMGSGGGRRAPAPFLTARVTFTDEQSGQVVGRVIASGYATSSGPPRKEERALVGSLTKAILSYLTGDES